MSNLVTRFFAHLTTSERNGMSIGLLAFIMTLVLLTSCTAETYCEDCEPIADVTYTVPAGPGVLDDYEQGVEYLIDVYCTGQDAGQLKVSFEENGQAVICTVAEPGEFGLCSVYDFYEQDGALFLDRDGVVYASFRLMDSGDLYGTQFVSGCDLVLRLS